MGLVTSPAQRLHLSTAVDTLIVAYQEEAMRASHDVPRYTGVDILIAQISEILNDDVNNTDWYVGDFDIGPEKTDLEQFTETHGVVYVVAKVGCCTMYTTARHNSCRWFWNESGKLISTEDWETLDNWFPNGDRDVFDEIVELADGDHMDVTARQNFLLSTFNEWNRIRTNSWDFIIGSDSWYTGGQYEQELADLHEIV